jgi:hypothetical protein
MSSKLMLITAALIIASPVLAASGANSGGSSGASTSSGGGGGHSGGGGGHGGGAGGGGGHFGGGGMGGRGAAASATLGGAFASHGHASAHSSAAREAKPISGQHVAFQHSTAKMPGTDHHHHHSPYLHRREPRWGNTFFACERFPRQLDPWNYCFGPTKSIPDIGTKRRS